MGQLLGHDDGMKCGKLDNFSISIIDQITQFYEIA